MPIVTVIQACTSSSSTRASVARDALGVGLRLPRHEHLFEHWPKLDYIEIISEDFLSDDTLARRQLARVRERYPVVMHGVGLNLLGHGDLDEDYLDRLCRLADELDAPFVTDHLGWTRSPGLSHQDVRPVAYTPALVEVAAARAAYVQRRLGRPFGLENLSTCIHFPASTMTEWEFYGQVVNGADCYFMLDINNVYVSSENHRFDPRLYLRTIDYSRVLQVHLAGHRRRASGTVVANHDAPVAAAVWKLYRDAYRAHGPFPTLLEWGEKIPPMPELLAELEKARAIRAVGLAR